MQESRGGEKEASLSGMWIRFVGFSVPSNVGFIIFIGHMSVDCGVYYVLTVKCSL